MTFEELGKDLCAERAKRGLSIEDVAARLKISPRLIRAIEEGNIEALPHQAYARGFIRSYAAFLGMAVEEVQDAANAVEVEDGVMQEAYPVDRTGGGAIRWLILLLALGLLGGGGYYAYKKDFFETASVHPPRLASPAPPAEMLPAASKVHETGSANLAPALPQHTNGPAVNKKQPDSILVPDKGMAKAGATLLDNEQKNEEGAVSKKNSGPHKVIIVATEECWIHSSADKTDTRQFSLRKGDTFALTFAHGLELKLGNAGGVRIRYDGREMEPAGQSGQVRTISFPPDDDR